MISLGTLHGALKTGLSSSQIGLTGTQATAVDVSQISSPLVTVLGIAQNQQTEKSS